LALNAGVWFRRGRLLMVSPVRGDYAAFRQKFHSSSCADFRGRLFAKATVVALLAVALI
jgi:hypothetical protein